MEELLKQKELLEKQEREMLEVLQVAFTDVQMFGILDPTMGSLLRQYDELLQMKQEIEQQILTTIETEAMNIMDK